MSPAITAPAPRLTNRAGRAQHMSVPVEVKRDRNAGSDEGDLISAVDGCDDVTER